MAEGSGKAKPGIPPRRRSPRRFRVLRNNRTKATNCAN
jgi:hypothetical protein